MMMELLSTDYCTERISTIECFVLKALMARCSESFSTTSWKKRSLNTNTMKKVAREYKQQTKHLFYVRVFNNEKKKLRLLTLMQKNHKLKRLPISKRIYYLNNSEQKAKNHNHIVTTTRMLFSLLQRERAFVYGKAWDTMKLIYMCMWLSKFSIRYTGYSIIFRQENSWPDNRTSK